MSKQLKKPAPGVPYCIDCGAKGSLRCSTCANKHRDAMHARLGTPPASFDDDDDDVDTAALLSKNKKRKKRQVNRDGLYDRHYTPNFE